MRTLDDLDVKGKTVLVRGDLNIPIKNGKILDTTRIKQLLPTLQELTTKGARVVICSHLGRPQKPTKDLSLRQIIPTLTHYLKTPVNFLEINGMTKQAISGVPFGNYILLENTRFYPGEETNDPAFAYELSMLADIYINDALSCSHRTHASVDGVARLLPSAAGRQMEQDLKTLEKVFKNPQPPVAIILGGAKMATKIPILKSLIAEVSTVILGGAVANTFLCALGKHIGKSVYEPEQLKTVDHILKSARKIGCQIILPLDVVVQDERARTQTVLVDHIPENSSIYDIGYRTVQHLTILLQSHHTVTWNGTLGYFENGTVDLAKQITALPLTTLVGGGDTIAAFQYANLLNKFTYTLTAGGAFLKWLEGKTLPALQTLNSYSSKVDFESSMRIRPKVVPVLNKE